jgi:hypothetical protein
MPSDRPLDEAEAQTMAAEFRAKFRNSEAFEQAWNSLFELRAAITVSLARRFLSQELVKFRAHAAGLETRDLAPPTEVVDVQAERFYECPGCHHRLGQWARDGHAWDCPHAGCYELEVRCRIGIARRQAPPLPPPPPPEFEAQFAAMHERLQSLPEQAQA